MSPVFFIWLIELPKDWLEGLNVKTQVKYAVKDVFFASVVVPGSLNSDGYSSLRESGFATVLMTKNQMKNTGENVSAFFDKKIAIYLSLGLHKGRPSNRRSLQFSKENIQHFKR